MSGVTTIGLDNAFHALGADPSGRALFGRKISRTKLLEFIASSRGARWRWRPAEARITEAASSRAWGMT